MGERAKRETALRERRTPAGGAATAAAAGSWNHPSGGLLRPAGFGDRCHIDSRSLSRSHFSTAYPDRPDNWRPAADQVLFATVAASREAPARERPSPQRSRRRLHAGPARRGRVDRRDCQRAGKSGPHRSSRRGRRPRRGRPRPWSCGRALGLPIGPIPSAWNSDSTRAGLSRPTSTSPTSHCLDLDAMQSPSEPSRSSCSLGSCLRRKRRLCRPFLAGGSLSWQGARRRSSAPSKCALGHAREPPSAAFGCAALKP